MKKMRLNKFIAECGIASRRNADLFIKEGRISVNDKTTDLLSVQIDPDKDVVRFDGEIIKLKRFVYYMLNKPKGVISSTKDEKKRKTVLDFIKQKDKIFPVGRLDYNSKGLILLTNDGNFANLITHPKNKIKKIYKVKLNRPLLESDIKTFLRGVYLKGKKGVFIDLSYDKKNNKIVYVTVEEGRNHFVKIMFGALNYNVLELTRIKIGNLKLDIPSGSYRKLSPDEIDQFLKNS